MFDAVQEGEVVGLVNCAGVNSSADPDDIWRTNFLGSLYCSELAFEKGAKSIVNVGSLVGVTGNYGPAVMYAASKAAVHNMTRTHARSFAPTCRVNCVAPGFMRTAIHRDPNVFPADGHALLGRWGTCEEVARSIVNVLLDETYMTGSIIEVGGGR